MPPSTQSAVNGQPELTVPFVIPTGQSLQAQLGMLARSVRVENFSNQWLFEQTTQQWILPYTLGRILRLPGTQIGLLINQAPPNQSQSPIVPTEYTSAVFSTADQDSTAGWNYRSSVPPPADRFRNPTVITSMIGRAITLGTGAADTLIYPAPYIVPVTRQAVITVVSLAINRQAGDTNPGTSQTQIHAVSPQGVVSNSAAGLVVLSGWAENYAGAHAEVAIPIQLTLLSGWSLNGLAHNGDAGAGGSIVYAADFTIFEYDL